jgi:hypothetical protein
MKTINVYPEPHQFNAAAIFVIGHVESGGSLEMHQEASPPWISARTANPDVIIAELQRTGVRYTVV